MALLKLTIPPPSRAVVPSPQETVALKSDACASGLGSVKVATTALNKVPAVAGMMVPLADKGRSATVIALVAVPLVVGGTFIWSHRMQAKSELEAPAENHPTDRHVRPPPPPQFVDPNGNKLHAVEYAVENDVPVIRITAVPNGDVVVIDAQTGRLIETRPPGPPSTTSVTPSRRRSAGGSSSPIPRGSRRSSAGSPTQASAWRRWRSRTSTTAPGCIR